MLRRDTLKLIASVSFLFAGLTRPLLALAKWNKAAFTATKFEDAINAYFPEQKIIDSDQINIGVHPVVENGAVVPVKVETTIENPLSITLFVDKNPNPLIANFDLSPDSIGFISTRIKVQEPSNIIATVKTDNDVYITRTFIEVHEGGCG